MGQRISRLDVWATILNQALFGIAGDPLDPTNMIQLSKRHHLPASTIRKVVGELVDNGLVTIDPAQTPTTVSLTTFGKRVLDVFVASQFIIDSIEGQRLRRQATRYRLHGK